MSPCFITTVTNLAHIFNTAAHVRFTLIHTVFKMFYLNVDWNKKGKYSMTFIHFDAKHPLSLLKITLFVTPLDEYSADIRSFFYVMSSKFCKLLKMETPCFSTIVS